MFLATAAKFSFSIQKTILKTLPTFKVILLEMTFVVNWCFMMYILHLVYLLIKFIKNVSEKTGIYQI